MKTNNVYKKGRVHVNTGAQDTTYERLIHLIGRIKPSEKIFDAGCANGWLGKHLKNKNVHLIGGDLNVKNTDKIKGYSKIINCDIEKNIPLKNKEVDTTISISVFQYLDDIDSALEECKRITRSRIIINVPNSKLLYWRNLFSPGRNANVVKYMDTKLLKNIGKKHGLKTKILYLSNKFDRFRKLWGNVLSGGIVAIYELE
jgi:ubiquinone/menaquinone biosynthesis C-methylase UbiE